MIDVVMRCRNDRRLLPATLAALKAQTCPHRLLAFDNASTDGSRELLAQHADVVVDVPAGQYIPGRVLNDAMQVAKSDIVVFLNSDCELTSPEALAHLVSHLEQSACSAAFAQQVPRPDCHPLHAEDIHATFGDGSRQKHWRHCFSMAFSAVRRTAWQRSPFREDLQYSEDIDWTWRLRAAGDTILYVPEAGAFHSHNYSLKDFYRRQFGEGRAEARIFEWTDWQQSLLRYSILPAVRQVLRDVVRGARTGQARYALEAPVWRAVGAVGRRRGFVAGSKGGR